MVNCGGCDYSLQPNISPRVTPHSETIICYKTRLNTIECSRRRRQTRVGYYSIWEKMTQSRYNADRKKPKFIMLLWIKICVNYCIHFFFLDSFSCRIFMFRRQFIVSVAADGILRRARSTIPAYLGSKRHAYGVDFNKLLSLAAVYLRNKCQTIECNYCWVNHREERQLRAVGG